MAEVRRDGPWKVIDVAVACRLFLAMCNQPGMNTRKAAQAMGYHSAPSIPFYRARSEGKPLVATRHADYLAEQLGAEILANTPPRRWSGISKARNLAQAKADQREADQIANRSCGPINRRVLSSSGHFEINDRDLVLDLKLIDFPCLTNKDLKAFQAANISLFNTRFPDFETGKKYVEHQADKDFAEFRRKSKEQASNGQA